MKTSVLIIFAFLLGIPTAFSQPCLPNWKHRVPITIDNSAQAIALTNFQVKLVLNTQTLITNGKLNIDGSDFRFLDANGSVIPYWIENNSINTSLTNVWLKIPNINANAILTIYGYYGNTSASPLSNGDNTFELFDDFNGASFNATKWNFCNTGIISLSDSKATFTSSISGSAKAILSSTATFTSPIRVESYISGITGSGACMGMYNNSSPNYQGYGMFYEFSGSGSIRMRKLNAPSVCNNMTNQTPSVNPEPSNNALGIWSFAWNSIASQSMDWTGASLHPILRGDNSFALGANQYVFVGNTELNGSVSIDWVRARKYTAIEPSVSVGTETAFITQLVLSNGGQVCEGNNVQLFVNGIVGATYTWTGPLGFTSNAQNPIVSTVGLNQAGAYNVAVTIPLGCANYTGFTTVTVNSLSVGGNTSGSAQVCSSVNSGIISVSGQNGSVIRWESSSSGTDPWNTIDIPANSIPYLNVLNSNYYRAIVKNGSCAEAYSTNSFIETFPKTKGGRAIGAASVCEGFNDGTLTLSNQVGDVVRWQSSTDNFVSNIVNINLSSELLDYLNILTTTKYRAEIKSGTCATEYSQPVEIKVNPKPDVSFVVSEACKGTGNTFTNTTTITTGRISTYTWDFGDGNGSTNRSLVYKYSQYGDFVARLYASSDKGCIDSVAGNVKVNPLPLVNFIKANVCDKQTMNFNTQSSIPTGVITGYFYSFNVNEGTLANPNGGFVFSVPGIFPVKHVVTSDKFCKDSITKNVTVYPRAKVKFTANDECIGFPIAFQNTSEVPLGNITYTWDFGDNTTSQSINPIHNYTASGTYIVALQVQTANNCSDDTSKLVTVFPGPAAKFSFVDVCLDKPAVFTNLSTVSSGMLASEWTFGDGTTSTDDSPIHPYETAGPFFVTLKVKTPNNCSDSKTKTIKINPLPKVNFTIQDACDKDTIRFSNQSSISTGTISSKWYFGDNDSLNTINANHLYDTSGTYNVKLRATSALGCQDSLTKNAVVFPLPFPNFIAPPVCHQFATIFQNTSSITGGRITNHSWNFADGSNSIDINPVKVFAKPQLYRVKLLTISDRGCRRDTVKDVIIYPNPKTNFNFENVCAKAIAFFNNESEIISGTLSYTWNFGDTTNTSILPNPDHQYIKPNTYLVKLISLSDKGCSDSLIKQIIISPPPTLYAGRDTTLSQGYSVQLFPKGAIQYNWSPSENVDNSASSSPFVRPLETTVYTVLGTDVNGCSNTATVTVAVNKDYKLMVSNVMTPDGNGENDTWYVENMDTFPTSKVLVYDRNGKKVFEKTGYQNDWDGADGFDILPDATYYYLITFADTDKVYKGAITILRNKK